VSKHTPGPWVVYRSEKVGSTIGIDSASGGAVVWYGDDPFNGIRNEADAQLICAAPDLLSALEKINEWACFASEEDINARLMALQQIGMHARAAIAKATGSQS
jgi:hypothetical protein